MGVQTPEVRSDTGFPKACVESYKPITWVLGTEARSRSSKQSGSVLNHRVIFPVPA